MDIAALKGLARSLRKRLYYIVKSTSFRLLRRLNADFEGATIRVETAPPVAPPHFSDRAAPRRGIERAVVVNGDQSVLNEEMVEFLLQGIFCGPCALPTARALFAAKLIHLSFEEADAVLGKLVTQPCQGVPESVRFAMCASYFRHREQTARNRNAYSTKDKPNPAAVFWPDPSDARNRRSLYTELPMARPTPLIDKTTRLASAGSCFAMEIAHALQKSGYRYLVHEPNRCPRGTYEVLQSGACAASSAAWGIIFNTPSFRQLVEKAFEVRRLPRILWTQEFEGSRRYLDPFRENLAFPTPEAYEANYAEHVRAARETFCEMDVLIITLGLNEVWRLKADGAVFSRNPWKTAAGLVEHRTLTVEENVQDLVRMTEILRAHNPAVKIIVTLSPVPLHATFAGADRHVVVANAHSKAVLRVAAEEFANRCKDVYYFPSYEMVTVCLKEPWAADQRHVTRAAVAQVMRLFHQLYDAESTEAPANRRPG